jgi:inner membrane protease subunit 1
MASRPANPHSWTRTSSPSQPTTPQSNTPTGLAFTLGKFSLVTHIFIRYIGGFGATTGISMLPTIPAEYRKRPYIFYSSLHRRGRWLKVGDVITYTHPLFPSQQGCKRVIGMPGDFVSVVTPGRADEDIEAVDTEGRWASVREQVVQVPEGHCWIAGDNLEWSRDSRLYGALPLGLVTAKVFAVVSSVGEAKWVGGDLDVGDVREEEHEWVVAK